MLVRGEEYKNLKSKDRVVTGDSILIFVQPFSNLYAYVIYSGNESAQLLNYQIPFKPNKLKIGTDDTLLLPSKNHLYVFDDKNSYAEFTIVCSLNNIPEFDSLFQNNQKTSRESWNIAEDKFLGGYPNSINEKYEKPISIAGNVRGKNIGEFLNKQPIFQGEETIIRNYKLEIKKK